MSTKSKPQDKQKMSEIDENISKLFDIKKRLGKGAYGIVWKALDKRTNETLAVKKIFDAFRDETDAQRTFREIIFLKAFREHPNIIDLQNVYKATNNLDIYLIFEYMESDLHNLIKKGHILKEVHKRYVMYQLINAIRYIHSGNVIHRDLKPSNVLVDAKCRCKLADFGLARSVSSRPYGEEMGNDSPPEPMLTDYVATRWYRAPEILVASKRYTKGIDMWSLGCILGEMISGKPLFQGTSTVNQIEKIVTALPDITDHDIAAVGAGFGSVLLSKQISRDRKTSLDELLCDAPQDAVDLVKALLVLDPLARLTAKESLSHAYVGEFRNTIVEEELTTDILPPFRDDIRLTVPEYRSKLYEIAHVKPEKGHHHNHSVKQGRNSANKTHSLPNTSNKPRVSHYERTASTTTLKTRSSSKSRINNTEERAVVTREKSLLGRTSITHKHEAELPSQQQLTKPQIIQKRRSSTGKPIIEVSTVSNCKQSAYDKETHKVNATREERAPIAIPRNKVVTHTKRIETLVDPMRASTAAYPSLEKRHSIDGGYASLPNGLHSKLSPTEAPVRQHDYNKKFNKSSSSLSRGTLTAHANSQPHSQAQQQSYAHHRYDHEKTTPVNKRLNRSMPTVSLSNGNERVSVRTIKSDGATVLSSTSLATKGEERICYEQRLKNLEEEIEKYKKEVKIFCKDNYRNQPQRASTNSETITSSAPPPPLLLPGKSQPKHHHHSQSNQSQSRSKHSDSSTRMPNLPPMPPSTGNTPKRNLFFKSPAQRSCRDYDQMYTGKGGGGSGDHIGRNTSKYEHTKPLARFI